MSGLFVASFLILSVEKHMFQEKNLKLTFYLVFFVQKLRDSLFFSTSLCVSLTQEIKLAFLFVFRFFNAEL